MNGCVTRAVGWSLVLVLSVLCSSAPALAGTAQALPRQSPAEWPTQVFELRYADPDQIRETLGLFNAQVTAVEALGLLTVRAPENVMPAIEEVIGRLDVPRRNVELTVHVLGADLPADSPKPMPEELESIVAELEDLFSYQDFQLVETLVVRGVDGHRIQSTGNVPSIVEGTEYASYQLLSTLQVRTDEVLGLQDMEFSVYSRSGIGTSINTSLEIPAGRHVVVGRGTFGTSAIVLVMNVRFVD